MKKFLLVLSLCTLSLSSAFSSPVQHEVANGLITCHRATDNLSIRFIPHLLQLEAKGSRERNFKACKKIPLYGKEAAPAPTESLKSINDKFLKASPSELASLWRSQENLSAVKDGTFYNSFDCGQTEISFMADVGCDGACTILQVVGNDLGLYARVDSHPEQSQCSGPQALKEGDDWSCSGFDSNFVGYILGPKRL